MAELEVIQGDITALQVDAIVNAANSSLLGGGGVDGAIHRAGGAAILEECRKIRDKQGGCPTGEAVITGAGRLPCKHVIHTVGPVWYDSAEASVAEASAGLLASCYRKSLLLAEEAGLATIAFPNISTGVYGYPNANAGGVAIAAVNGALPECPGIMRVVFVCFDRENLELYREILKHG
jgi:O-acetyl-ADP-ribose deacetylase (regulator of RNase III)